LLIPGIRSANIANETPSIKPFTFSVDQRPWDLPLSALDRSTHSEKR
jgi:hypothetical protein